MAKPKTAIRDARRAARLEARRQAVLAVRALAETPPPQTITAEDARAAFAAEARRLAGTLNYKSKTDGRAV